MVRYFQIRAVTNAQQRSGLQIGFIRDLLLARDRRSEALEMSPGEIWWPRSLVSSQRDGKILHE